MATATTQSTQPTQHAQELEKLTHSRMACAKSCLRKHHYRYELGLSRDTDATALRMGSAVHHGLELWSLGKTPEESVNEVLELYALQPYNMSNYDFSVEKTIVITLLAGYFWYYENDDIEYIEVEEPFNIPLVNPATGKPSRTYTLAGKRDGLIRMNGQVYVLERKTTGMDIGSDSKYWLRLRCDQQISLYMTAAIAAGLNPDAVLYDVIRKPTIKPYKATPEEKRKYKKDGALYANMREENESVDDYGTRLWEDIVARPEYYYQRREIPRLYDDLEEFKTEAWAIADMMRKHYKFRNVSQMTCDFCQFADLCLQNINVDPTNPPVGFTILEDKYPELEERK